MINLKNKARKCFMWCHIRLINPTDTHPERINKEDQKIAVNLNYSVIEFPLNIKNLELIEDLMFLVMRIKCIHYMFQKNLTHRFLIYY